MKKAYIKRVKHGETAVKGEFYYVLCAENGEPTDTSETFNSKQACKKTLAHQHPEYKVIDLTKE